MSSLQPDIHRFERSVHDHWVLFLVEGVVLIVLGATAIVIPPLATLAATIVLGWLLLVSGIMGLITTFWIRSAPGFWWSLISGLLAIVVGVMLLAAPVRGAVSLTLVLIAFFIVEGVVDIMLAGLIVAGLPSTAAWAIGLLVGINMVFGGVALAIMALHAREASA